jgi:hypothetical protein
MSQRRARREEFFREHPMCCFCGGLERAVEEDHVPSRDFFAERQWPEGYVFPACVACNRASRSDELIVSFLASMSVPPQPGEDVEERFRVIARNFPGLIEEMHMSAQQRKQVARSLGLPRLVGESDSNAPILRGGAVAISSLDMFARKLFLALYYKHSGKILGHEGGVAVILFPNTRFSDIPYEQITSLCGNVPRLERSSHILNEQFAYMWGMSADRSSAVFLSKLKNAFMVLGYVQQSRAGFDLPDDTKILQPFHW